MGNRAVRIVIGVVIVLGLSGIAFWGGTEAKRLLGKSPMNRQELTTQVLSMMNSIKIGDTLPDYQFFKTLENETVKLSDLVTGPTWLIFMLPDCDECIEELNALQPVFTDPTKKTKAIFISNAKPLELIDVRQRYTITAAILHDSNAVYTTGINVSAFPFNILVNNKLQIVDMVAGHIDPEDF